MTSVAHQMGRIWKFIPRKRSRRAGWVCSIERARNVIWCNVELPMAILHCPEHWRFQRRLIKWAGRGDASNLNGCATSAGEPGKRRAGSWHWPRRARTQPTTSVRARLLRKLVRDPASEWPLLRVREGADAFYSECASENERIPVRASHFAIAC